MSEQKSVPPFLDEDHLPIGLLINETSKFFHDRMRRETEKLGIRDGYRQMLFHLAREDGGTQLDLVRCSHLKPPTVSVTLKKMEDDGYVIRETDPTDLRQVRVYITEKGRTMNEAIHGKLHETEDILVTPLNEGEEEQLRQLLLKIRRHYNSLYQQKSK